MPLCCNFPHAGLAGGIAGRTLGFAPCSLSPLVSGHYFTILFFDRNSVITTFSDRCLGSSNDEGRSEV